MCCCMIQSHQLALAASPRQIAINQAAAKIEDVICCLTDADHLLLEHLTQKECCELHIGVSIKQMIGKLFALDDIRYPSRTDKEIEAELDRILRKIGTVMI